MPFCDTCGRYRIQGHEHDCPPSFTVSCPEFDTSRTVRADDHEDAAKRWADIFDWDGDYIIVGGEEPVVVVTDGTGEQKTFRVSGRSVPVYDAVEIKEGEGQQHVD